MVEHEGNEMSAFELPKAGKQFRICDTGQVLTYEQMTSGIDADLVAQLDRLVDAGASSMRGIDRMLRLAWTLADLDGAPYPTIDHIVAAQQLRNGQDHDN